MHCGKRQMIVANFNGRLEQRNTRRIAVRIVFQSGAQQFYPVRGRRARCRLQTRGEKEWLVRRNVPGAARAMRQVVEFTTAQSRWQRRSLQAVAKRKPVVVKHELV